MVRKTPSWRQPLLDFPPDSAATPEPHENIPSQPEGGPHALQDHLPRTPRAAAGNSRAAAPKSDLASDAGARRPGAEDPPRRVEGSSLPAEAGQRPEPDRERGAGAGPQGTGGLF